MTQLIPWQDNPKYREEIERIQRVYKDENNPTRISLEQQSDKYYAILRNPEVNVFKIYEIIHGKEMT